MFFKIVKFISWSEILKEKSLIIKHVELFENSNNKRIVIIIIFSR